MEGIEEQNEVDEAINEEVMEMSDSELQEFNDSMVAEVKEFIERNSERNAKQVKRIREDRDFAAGKQWDDKDRTNRTEGRLELSIPICQNIISAVTNPISAHPYRIKAIAKPQYKEMVAEGLAILNERLLKVQDDYEYKSANDYATKDMATDGLGFTYATTVDNDGVVDVCYRLIEDVTKVIWDADAKSITMEDAKQAVVVELIKEADAEERFGTDIWGGKLPSKTTLADLGGDIVIPEGLVPLLTYFRVEGHNCEFHRLIGEQVVESDLIEGLGRIPLVAFIGEKTWFDGELGMSGLVHRLRPMQKLANYANAQMVERLAMSTKASFMGSDDAVDGYEDIWENANYSTSAYLPFHSYDKEGNQLQKPEMVMMGAKVDDLQSVINGAVQQMQFASGVAATGIVDQTIQDQATATEVLLRTKSSQSNVSHYLEHTKESVKAAGKVLAEMCISVYGLNVPRDTYEIIVDGGSAEITKMEEDRKSLLAMMQFAPDSMKQVITIGLMNTLDIPQAESMASMMFKMLPPEVQQVAIGNGANDVAMLQQQNVQLQQQLQQMQSQLQQVSIENQQLQLRSKSDVLIKQMDSQVQLQKQKMQNENAVLLKQMELNANAMQSTAEANVEAVGQERKIIADAELATKKAQDDLNAELVKAENNARLEIMKEHEKAKSDIAKETVQGTTIL